MRSLVLIAAIVVMSGLARRLVSRWTDGVDCETACRTATDGMALHVCQREYAGTKRPVTGAYLADALQRSGNFEAASSLANELLTTDARPDALSVLAQIAVIKGQSDDAVGLLLAARQLRRETGDRLGLAKDDQALARIQAATEQYAAALQTADECITEAGGAGDRRTLGYCRITAAQVLMRAGYFEASHQELERAEPLLSENNDHAAIWFERGNLEQVVEPGMHSRAHEQAVTSFERALALATRTQRTMQMLRLHLNLAYSLAELGRTADADRSLSEAALLDRDAQHGNERALLAARIAYRRGDFALAASLVDKLYPTLQDDAERLDLSVIQARIALAAKDFAGAESWAQRGVALAEHLRAEQRMSELRPWVLASRRAAFELLFVVLARFGRVQDAVVIFDLWRGRTLLDNMARPNPDDPFRGLSSTASRIQSLRRWLPAASQAPLMASDAREVIARLSKIDLVALAVAEGTVWRLTGHGGQLKLDDLGSIEEFRERLDRFSILPTDPALADELGALILPGDLVRTTDDPLYVVLSGPFASLPFAALRRNGQPLIAARPVLWTPRIPVTRRCEHHADGRSALVIADAAGDLPDARHESSRIASLFQTTPLVGPAATSAALFMAHADSLLHIAVHADFDAGGGILNLHDRAVSAPELAAQKLGPSLVVLSACSTARSGDPDLAGSLAMAFLAGGSQRVIATLRPISDAGALELTNRFYQAGGAEAPVQVLARVQAELAQTDNKEWPSFAVFGNDVCQPDGEADPLRMQKRAR